MKTLFDYQEAAEFMDLLPAYVKRLCDLRKLGYVVKECRRGYMLRGREEPARKSSERVTHDLTYGNVTFEPPIPAA